MSAVNDARHSVPPAATLHDLLKLELCHIVARQSIAIFFPVIAAQVVVAAIAWGRVPGALLATWCIAVGLVHATRLALLRRPIPADGAGTQARIRAAVTMSLVSGLVNASSVLFLAYLPLHLQAIHTVVLMGLCAGCVAVNVGHLGIVLGFLAPIISVLTLFWVSQGNWEAGSVSLLIVFFGFTLLFLSRDTYRTFERSVAIRLDNAELARKLEIALQRAEAASRSKTRFLASASHDLRQPLHSLLLNAGTLARGQLDDKARDIVRDMKEALEDLSEELDSLLDISKLDAGVVAVDRTTFDLAAFLARICQPFVMRAEAQGLAFERECPPGVFVRTDRVLLERMVRNLVDNAFKYTTAGRVRVEARVDGKRCRLAVSDSGIGIAPAEHERVFEEFYQVDNPERDRHKGLGLGLPIVRRHADLLDIEIAMQSAPGRGTTFTLELGTAAPPPRRDVPSNTPLPAFHHRQFLVIDDEAGSRDAMQGYLETLGCQVSVAATIHEATAMALQQEPDLVIADFRLRGTETGLQAIAALRKTRPFLPALLITGDTAPDKLAEMNAASIPLLHKPVAPTVLVDNIALLLEAQ